MYSVSDSTPKLVSIGSASERLKGVITCFDYELTAGLMAVAKSPPSNSTGLLSLAMWR